MFLGIDMGNTTISLAIVEDGVIKCHEQVDVRLAGKDLKRTLEECLLKMARKFPSVTRSLSCSVVPKKNSLVKTAIKKIFKSALAPKAAA